MRRRLLLGVTLLAACVAALALAACGSDTGASSPTSLVPQGAVIYGEATIKPSGDQKEAIDELASKVPGDKSPGQLAAEIVQNGLKESDSKLDYDKDIKPWLGEKAAFFVTDVKEGREPSAAALVQTVDEDATNDAIDKDTGSKAKTVKYKNVEYKREDADTAAGVIDGFLVLGNERGVKAAIDASKGDVKPIDDEQNYKDTLKSLDSDRLGFMFLNTPKLLDAARGTLGSGFLGAFGKALSQPYVIAGDADSDGVEFTSTLPTGMSRLILPMLGEGTDLIKGLPGDSWGALAQPNLGKTLDTYVDLFGQQAGGREQLEAQVRQATGLNLQRDIIGWMGDFGVFVRGTSVPTVNGALVIETSDPAASDRALAVLQRQLRRQDDTTVTKLSAPVGGAKGFTARSSDTPRPIHVFRKGDRVVGAYGDAAARDAVKAGSPLSGAEDFNAASGSLGDGYDVSTFLSMAPILDLVESSGQASSDPDWKKVKPYLEAIGAIVAGTHRDGDKLTQKVRVTVP